MEYFRSLAELLKIERQEDREQYRLLNEQSTVSQRRNEGLCWYPVAIRGSEMSRGDYLTVEIERTTHHELPHQLRFGMPAALFSNHDPKQNRIEGVITHLNDNRLKINFRVDELPDWADDGKLGIDLLFDDNSYEEMNAALKQASVLAEKEKEGSLVKIITGEKQPVFHHRDSETFSGLNHSQNEAVNKILTANDLAIVHGPPGTGKTSTLVRAITAIARKEPQQILVVAPSNTAVDLLSEKLSDAGLNVLRVGNPARVSDRLASLTLDNKMNLHARMKEIKNMRKQANEFRNMAHKYKRNFGRAEREQRKALFDEAHKIIKEAGNTEQYIIEDIIAKAQVITATLVGANHYTVKNLSYHTIVIDEAGQSLEPACWIPVIKGKKLVLAGDPYQLPPTIKSDETARKGLGNTLLEKLIALHPQSVVLLEEQYRMNEMISAYPSKIFYENKLRADPSVKDHLVFPGDCPLRFIDTAGCGFDEKVDGTSVCNPEEAAFVFRHLSDYIEELKKYYTTGELPSIAVISPYRQQIELLKEQSGHTPALKNYGGSISVNTIDSFQGQERDIVYISMTRSNTENRIGFLSDIRRMNVAMTRARKKLVVIGDSATLSQLPFYAGFIEYAERAGAYQSAWEFMS